MYKRLSSFVIIKDGVKITLTGNEMAQIYNSIRVVGTPAMELEWNERIKNYYYVSGNW